MRERNILRFTRKRKLPTLLLIVCCSFALAIFSAALFPEIGLASIFSSAPIGSNVPDDATLLAQRQTEVTANVFDVAEPGPGTVFTPAERVPRKKFGVVGTFPLGLKDLDALVYPSATKTQREALVEGIAFFTTPHLAVEGAGPIANQQMCLGCHLSSAEATPNSRVVRDVSNVSRAARSTPTNFKFTALDPATGGGRAADNLDAINNTGLTAAFTTFGDYNPAQNIFDPLDGVARGGASPRLGGFVQHTRFSIPQCLPERIPTIAEDPNLPNIDPVTKLSSLGFRRGVVEFAGPPYIGRGLMEAIPTNDIRRFEDEGSDTQSIPSSLNNATIFACTGDCITGKTNTIPTPSGTAITAGSAFAGGVGRFGLRANGVEILQFVAGGLQGEVGFTSILNRNEPTESPTNRGRPGCDDPYPDTLESHLSVPLSERNFLRMTAPPEFGDTLLAVLNNPTRSRPAQSPEGQVKRGAELFGIDLVAFSNRMIPGRFPGSGDGRDPNAINRNDSMVSCASCHIPVQRTGQSPATTTRDGAIVAQHLSYKWAPIFSDLLLHNVPQIDAERWASLPRDPLVVNRQYQPTLSKEQDATNAVGRSFATFDIPRNLAGDVFANGQAAAFGDEFRTPPLMGLGRMGPPFLHDARVYLSRLTFNTNPAGTVFTNNQVTNAPLVVRTLDDAIRAAIELHDLPAPDDSRTPAGGGCPVPPGGAVGNISYGSSPSDVICPPYNSEVSRTHRSDAKEVIRRYRSLSPSDQQSIIEFLKEL